VGRLGGRLSAWAHAVKRELLTVHYASRHPQTPRGAKLLAGLVLLYALSPVHLVPDFVPVLGYLDDAVLLPLGVLLVARLVPAAVWTECRAQAEAQADRKLPRNRAGVLWWSASGVCWPWVCGASSVGGPPDRPRDWGTEKGPRDENERRLPSVRYPQHPPNFPRPSGIYDRASTPVSSSPP